MSLLKTFPSGRLSSSDTAERDETASSPKCQPALQNTAGLSSKRPSGWSGLGPDKDARTGKKMVDIVKK